MPENRLYYGDNLDVLRRYVEDASVDLVYLDPPFKSKSNQDYNVLFAEKSGTKSAMANKSATVNIQFRRDADGSYSASITAKADGQAAWQGGVFRARTPLAALKRTAARIEEDLSPSNRGRNPTGYKSLVAIEYGW